MNELFLIFAQALGPMEKKDYFSKLGGGARLNGKPITDPRASLLAPLRLCETSILRTQITRLCKKKTSGRGGALGSCPVSGPWDSCGPLDRIESFGELV